jgi:hypothetical protein
LQTSLGVSPPIIGVQLQNRVRPIRVAFLGYVLDNLLSHGKEALRDFLKGFGCQVLVSYQLISFISVSR